jgi:hypothetical protein
MRLLISDVSTTLITLLKGISVELSASERERAPSPIMIASASSDG